MPVVAWITASRPRRAADLVALLGTKMMSSGWSSGSGAFDARIFFSAIGISLRPVGVLRISLVLSRDAVEFAPWAIAIAWTTVNLEFSMRMPLGSRTSPTTYTIPAFDTTTVSPGYTAVLLFTGPSDPYDIVTVWG